MWLRYSSHSRSCKEEYTQFRKTSDFDNWLQLTNVLLELARIETSIGKTMASLERIVGKQLTPLR